MQQPGVHPAQFYAKLVDLPAAADNQNDARCKQPSAVHDGFTPTLPSAESNAVHAAEHYLKPVKFAQPVILDPNTGAITSPPSSDGDSLAKDGIALTAAGNGHHSYNQAAQATALFGGRTSQPAQQLSSWQPDQQVQYIQQQHIAHPDAPTASGSSYKRPIDRSNVGYKLLAKSGWQEGQGLGAQQQGMAAPLQVVPQKGNLGLGFAKKHKEQDMVVAHSSLHQESALPLEPAAGPVLGSKRAAALVAAELAAEDVEAKVRRHRQVQLQEAQDKRDKAIQSYLFRAFNEPSSAATRDSSPLTKHHRLTATNPLLD